jgi:hypothetical protein
MLRSKWRIDIEDRGCSGETFLAAVEILFKEKPSLTIFENVINAPWMKMADYITGRVKLNSIDKRTRIKDEKDKGQKLTFVRGKDGIVIVDQVPGVYGVRCGSTLKGFVRGNSDEILKAKWPSSADKKCSLEDLMKFNQISKASDTIVFDTPCCYCTKVIKVDTKDFGLPQTRQRCYMLVWRPTNDNINDDLGDYWEQVVEFLQEPAVHSLESFLLEDDHEIVRLYREALNGPAGRQSAREYFLQPDWLQSGQKNVKHNTTARERNGIRLEARYVTNWDAFGVKQVAPHILVPYLNCNEPRVLDMIDIQHAAAARDAESHDAFFSSFLWNISQNVSREPHRTMTPGVAGCMTPGGKSVVSELAVLQCEYG